MTRTVETISRPTHLFTTINWLRTGAAVLSGVLLANTYGLNPWWPVAWLAPVPLLAALLGARWQWAIGLGAIAGGLASLSLFSYLTGLGGIGAALAITVLRAVQWAGLALAAWTAHRHLPAVAGVLVFPALLAGFEVVMALLSPHGSGGSIAYSQMDALVVIQIASLGGTAAIAFLLGNGAMILTIAVTSLREHWRTLMVLVVLLGLGLGYGAYRLVTVPSHGGPLVAMVATDEFDGVPTDWEPVWDAHIPAIESAAEQGANVIVLPEKLFQLDSAQTQTLLDEAAALAASHNVTLVFGIDQRDTVAYNRAYLVAPDSTAHSYDKQHMIPGFESHFTTGTDIVTHQIDGATAGLLICKDLDFPTTVRQAGAQTAMLLVPAWDFIDDAWFHSRIAVLRGVENGVSVVRAARRGYLTLSDPTGRILVEAPSGPGINSATEPSGTQMMLGRVPNATGVPTVYGMIGETFGWAAAAYSVICILLAVRHARREKLRQAAVRPASSEQDAGRITTAGC